MQSQARNGILVWQEKILWMSINATIGKKPITLTFAKAMYVVFVWRFAILEEKLFHAPDPEVFELF
jgi:hypothetical protein